MFDDFNISQWTISPPQRTHRTPWNFNISRKSWDPHMTIHYTQVPSSTMGRQWVSPYGALPRLTTSRARVGSWSREWWKDRRQVEAPKTVSTDIVGDNGRRFGNPESRKSSSAAIFHGRKSQNWKHGFCDGLDFRCKEIVWNLPKPLKPIKNNEIGGIFYKIFIILERISETFMSHSNALLYHQQRNHFWFSQSSL